MGVEDSALGPPFPPAPAEEAAVGVRGGRCFLFPGRVCHALCPSRSCLPAVGGTCLDSGPAVSVFYLRAVLEAGECWARLPYKETCAAQTLLSFLR